MKVGDWVEGRTMSAHKVVGYVERIEFDGQDMWSSVRRQALIRVVRCCCSRVSATEWADVEDIKLLSDTCMSDSEGNLLNAIDFALDTGDREEFMRRTEELRKLRGFQSTRVIMTFIPT